MSDGEIALIVGVGPALGSALARRCAADGMAVAVAARDGARLQPLAEELGEMGVSARAYGCDAGSERDVDSLFGQVQADLGAPGLVVFNVGGMVRGGILELEAADMERCWRAQCLGGFLVGRRAARLMTARMEQGGAGGTILFTGATASLRGGAGFAAFASGKFGLRAVAQSMARELGPKGIHVAHVIIDGQILSERRAELARERPEDGLLKPEAIADAYLAIHRQPRSAWTHELDLRPWVEKF